MTDSKPTTRQLTRSDELALAADTRLIVEAVAESNPYVHDHCGWGKAAQSRKHLVGCVWTRARRAHATMLGHGPSGEWLGATCACGREATVAGRTGPQCEGCAAVGTIGGASVEVRK